MRRVNRAQETAPELVAAKVPFGSMRAAHGDQVMAQLLKHPEFARMRRDSQRTTVAVLSCLIVRADYTTMTTRPGHAALAEAAGRGLRTVQRVMRRLESWGFIGLVAGGRQARYAAAGPDGERINEAAVYVLAVPSPLALVKGVRTSPVDEDVVPPALGGTHLVEEELTHTRAGETHCVDAATPRLIESVAASGGATPPPAHRPDELWPTHRTTKTPRQRLAAARQLRHRVLVLRPMSDKDLRSVSRDFFKAGWTVADLHHALDWRPDGTKWPYSPPPTDAPAWRTRGWLRHRLAAWRTSSGEPLYSRTQRSEADHRQQRALQAIEYRRILAERAERAAKVAEHLEQHGSYPPTNWRTKYAAEYEQGKQEAQAARMHAWSNE